jgi:hypothetical protein
MMKAFLSTAMCVLVCVALPAGARSLTDAEMYLNPDEAPYDHYERVVLDDLSVDNDWLWSAAGDDVIDADILPVLREGPGVNGLYPPGYGFTQADYYQKPNVDYFADVTGGALTVRIMISGQYSVRVHRASGASQIWTVFAETGMLELGDNKTGASRKISGPSGDLIIVSEGDGTLDQAAKNIQNEDDGSGGKKKVTRAKGVDDVVDKIKAASRAAGKKIHVELVGHGASGMISTNDSSTADGDLIGPDEADIKEFQEAIDDYVNGLSLFSCSSAEGDAGAKLLSLLASSLGWASGYIVPITVEDGYFNVEKSSTLSLVNDVETLSPANLYGMRANFSEFSMSARSMPLLVDGVVRPSGDMFFTLDPTWPREDNFVWYDFMQGMMMESVHVEMDCPLFTELGIPGQRLHIFKQTLPGAVMAFGMVNPTIESVVQILSRDPSLVHDASRFEPGQLMEGWQYADYRSYPPETAIVEVSPLGARLIGPAKPLIRTGVIETAMLQPPPGSGLTLPPLQLMHQYMQLEAPAVDPCPSPGVVGDLDGDRDVDVSDLAVFAGNWLVGR